MDEKEIDRTASEYANNLERFESRKRFVSFKIPNSLKFSIAWLLFFTIIGIIFQSIDSGRFIFLNFFTTNYVSWFNSLGNFSNVTRFSSEQELIATLLSKWYYFLFTGGLISIIWNLIFFLFKFKVRTSKQNDSLSNN